jgi:hypothetical protein
MGSQQKAHWASITQSGDMKQASKGNSKTQEAAEDKGGCAIGGSLHGIEALVCLLYPTARLPTVSLACDMSGTTQAG